MNKICTDILQSKKLAEILPLESADCYYPNRIDIKYQGILPIEYKHGNPLLSQEIAVWSISALLEIIRNNGRYELQMFEGGYYFEANGFMTESYFNSVDTCYEFILKLYELNML